MRECGKEFNHKWQVKFRSRACMWQHQGRSEQRRAKKATKNVPRLWESVCHGPQEREGQSWEVMRGLLFKDVGGMLKEAHREKGWVCRVCGKEMALTLLLQRRVQERAGQEVGIKIQHVKRLPNTKESLW